MFWFGIVNNLTKFQLLTISFYFTFFNLLSWRRFKREKKKSEFIWVRGKKNI